ncbi:13118_t:CDS:2 [Funneliformis mosseae]|uniref:13118_t:CDS:1 n=1 Tax=Funneliformis mosseae TaxID=27381 RepID=A0A9N9ARA3_FUNMO|nr:13118_t:CDS:2 [Funneliformis mosseae]
MRKTSTGTASSRGTSKNVTASSVRDAIAQARSKKTNNKDVQLEEQSEVGPKSLNVIVKQAKSSGRLNISHRSLTEIPEEVWRMYEVDSKSISIDFGGSASDVWYEQVNLIRLVAADNFIKEIDKRIIEFDALAFIDLHNNHLTSLPGEFGELKNLAILNLSTNKFNELPTCLTSLKSLVELQLASNNLSGVLDPTFGNLSKLEILDISQNEITGLPQEISNLKNLRKLFLAKNKLRELPGVALTRMTYLEELEASENLLEIVFKDLNGQEINLQSLKRLDVRQNKLKALDESHDATIFHPSVKLPKLKELLISLNQIKSLGPLLHTTSNLEILDIGDNKLSEIPEGLIALKYLKRLDISNNELKHLPAELGLLSTLDVLVWEGNPLRNAPKGPKSTANLLKTLKDRLITVDLDSIEGPTIPERTMSGQHPGRVGGRRSSSSAGLKTSGALGTITQQGVASKSLDLSKKNLSNIDQVDLEELTFEPTMVILGFNTFQAIPIGFQIFQNTITTFKLDHNKFTSFPTFDDPSIVFPNVDTLDLSANQITRLPGESDHTAFPNLQVFNVNQNRIAELPTKLPFPKLTTFLATSNNLTSIVTSTFEGMEVVDVSNNNIGHLPPELGNIQTIKTLLVGGNSFRVPRYTIVQKGTEAVMEYLRGRIPRS